jgi:hypothetical protein
MFRKDCTGALVIDSGRNIDWIENMDSHQRKDEHIKEGQYYVEKRKGFRSESGSNGQDYKVREGYGSGSFPQLLQDHLQDL